MDGGRLAPQGTFMIVELPGSRIWTQGLCSNGAVSTRSKSIEASACKAQLLNPDLKFDLGVPSSSADCFPSWDVWGRTSKAQCKIHGLHRQWT